ncbi:MAG: thiol reductant ABC exporter subunit CydD [Anaerolineales bacterium]|nr:thiol reductant ABC exporter subunit CydD [Anaerolineales bacterium]
MNFDRRLLSLLGISKRALIITIALGLTGGALAIGQAWIFARIVTQVFINRLGFQQVLPVLFALLILIILRAIVTWGYDSAGGYISNPIKKHLRQRLYQRILEKGPQYTSQESTGELVNTTVEGVEGLEAYYSQYIPQVFLAVFIPLIFLVFVAPVDWISALVMLATAPLIPIFMILIGYVAQAITRRQWLSLSRMSAYFLDVLQGLTTLKMLGRSREQGKVIARVSQRYTQTTMSVLRVAFLSAFTLELVATLSTAVVAVQLGLRLLYGWISFEQALFVLALTPEFYLPLRMLGTRFHAGIAGVEAGKRIFQVLGEERTCDQALYAQAPAAPVSRNEIKDAIPEIRFREVYFEYEKEQGAINGVDFSIEPGEKIALVGASGAGKSTLTALLLGFIAPDKGAIMVGGRSLSEISLQSWRRAIAWVPQKPYLFRDSITANIRLANPAASHHEVIRAAQLANADEFIRELPHGYETIIGERGARLSAGQMQRIALARAFLKDAPLLIIDEGISHLDGITASLVQQTIQQLSENRTVLVIAHQLSTVRQVDRIFVMDNGQIVQSGRHEELSQQDGIYRELLDSGFYSQDMNNESIVNPMIDTQQSFEDAFIPHSIDKDSNPPRYTSLALFSRLIGLISPYSGWIALSALLGFATVASSIGLAATSAYIISAAALQPSIAVLQVAIVGVRFFGLSRGVFRYLERYVSHKVTLQVLGRLRLWFYEALEPLAPARLLVRHSGDLLSCVIGDIGALENFYVRALYPPLVAIATAVLLGVYFGMFSLQLVAPFLILFVGACLAVPCFMNYLSGNSGKVLIDKRAILSERLVEGVQGLADVLLFGYAERQTQRILDASNELEANCKKMISLSGMQNALMGLFSNSSLWVVLWLAIPLVDANQISGVHLAGLALAALAGFEAVVPLPQAGQYLQSNLKAAHRLFELVDTQAEVIDPENPLPLPDGFDLIVDGLTFGYPQKDQDHHSESMICESEGGAGNTVPLVLRNLSFTLPQGKRMVIVGPSGVGKTTLLHLLLRFWDYQEGTIKLGGNDIRLYHSDDLRKKIAVVPQDAYLFNTTLRENLLLAKPDADQEQVVFALKQAQLEELTNSLPEGLDTWLGEHGVRLSAGERQRVAIARAILRDTPIFLLDEATANLDAVTARHVMGSLENAIQGKSVIMITHQAVETKGAQVMMMKDSGVKIRKQE